MAKMKTILVVLLVSLCLFVGVTPTMAKEKPVDGVWTMFDDFNDLENQFRNDKWSEATATVGKIDSNYKKLLESLKATVDGKTLSKFGFLLDSLKKKIEAKSTIKEINKPYSSLQTLFLDIMNYYEYPNPPVLLLAARYVDEAREALEKGDVRDAGEEMEEIENFKSRIVEALKEKGAADPDGFMKKVEAAGKAAEAGKKDEVMKIVTELESYIAPYKK